MDELDPLALRLFRHLLMLRLPIKIDCNPSPAYETGSTAVRFYGADGNTMESIRFKNGRLLGYVKQPGSFNQLVELTLKEIDRNFSTGIILARLPA